MLKSIVINNYKNDLKYNYQSFLAERLNFIHQNLDDKKEKEKNNIDIKEKNKIQEVEYYKYDNFSKKDIMNYYFNIDNINNNNIEIKNFNDSIKMDKAYKAEDKIIKENIQKNDIKMNFNSNNNNKIIKNETKKENIIIVQQNENDLQNKSKLINSNNNINNNNNNIIIDKSTNNIKNLYLDNYVPNKVEDKEIFINNNNYNFNIEKNNSQKNITFPVNKSIDTLESVNIRKMEEEEEGRKIVLEDEYKKLTLLEKEKMKLIEEEKMIRKKILEEAEKQEKAEKKMEMRMRYFEKVKKKEEDEKKLNDIKLKQEQELKEIKELKNKKKFEEERLVLILEGKLRLNNQEIKSYRNNLYYEDNNKKDTKIYININNQENLIEKKNKTIANNEEINIKNKYNKKYNNNFDIQEVDKNNKKINQTITQYIVDKREKENKENNLMIFSPGLSSLSNKISTLSAKSPRNNFETYEPSKSNTEKLISLPIPQKEDKINSNNFYIRNNFMTNDPTNDREKALYGKKKKKHMKRKRIDNSMNYKTNIYNDKKVFQKLMDNINYEKEHYIENKENNLNEVNRIQEIAARAKNEIDKTINAIKNIGKNMNKLNYNTERNVIKTTSNLTDNPYLKYGKKYSKQKKENAKLKSFKQNINLTSRNFNEYFSDNYDEDKYQKYPKENDINKIDNDENIDYKNIERNEYENNQKDKKILNFNGVLSDSSSKFTNYYKEIYGKK